MLSHSAVVAREYRIPAVVGTGNATSTFQDGQLLEVDGDAGTVRVVVEEVKFMNLLWLGDPKSFDVALVGGKAANLSRLARSCTHRVPDGFSLPVTVMDEAHPLDLRDEIIAAISDLMACHSLPDFIAAVRSSAVDEDGSSRLVRGPA